MTLLGHIQSGYQTVSCLPLQPRKSLWKLKNQKRHLPVQQTSISSVFPDIPNMINKALACISSQFEFSLRKRLKKGLCYGTSIFYVALIAKDESQTPFQLASSLDQKCIVAHQINEIVLAYLHRIQVQGEAPARIQAAALIDQITEKRIQPIEETHIPHPEQLNIHEKGLYLLRLYNTRTQKGHAILIRNSKRYGRWFYNQSAHGFYLYRSAEDLREAIQKHIHIFHPWALNGESCWLLERYLNGE